MSREFRLILRFMGTDIDGTKKVAYGLGKIRGVGPNLAFAVVKAAKINPEARMGALSDGELSRVEDVIKDPLKHGIPPRMVNRRKDIETGRDMHLVGADLALKIKSDIDLMKDIQSWKGVRHSLGLKFRNKRELRGHETELSQIRGIARTLLGTEEEERGPLESQYLKRLARLGILPESATVDNILDLNVKDLMERRLQTIVHRTGLAKSIHQARQFVIHGHISVAGDIVSVPSYVVQREQESRIAFHARSRLSNAQHPARASPTGKRV